MRGYPLSLATLASSPKGSRLNYAGNFPATAKSRPLGEGGCERSEQTEGVSSPLGKVASRSDDERGILRLEFYVLHKGVYPSMGRVQKMLWNQILQKQRCNKNTGK